MRITFGFLQKALPATIAVLAFAGQSFATLTVLAPDIATAPNYTHSTSDNIVSFDRDSSGNLFYLTANPANGNNATLWKSSGGGSPTSLYNAAANFPDPSVVTINNHVFFGDESFTSRFVRTYGPTNGSPSLSLRLTSPDYLNSEFAHNGSLFITGASSTFTQGLYYSPVAADGSVSPLVNLGLADSTGGSGPLAFDSAGNMYYAPGYGDTSIYKWTTAELAAAIADPTGHALLVNGHLWAAYPTRATSLNVSGASSMAFDASGNLLVTLTQFASTSYLTRFGVGPTGVYSGSNDVLLSETTRLGDVRNMDGNVYLAAGNSVVQIVPEPSAALLVLAGLAAGLQRRRRS